MSKTILVVDDSASFRNVVKIALCSAGYVVQEASNGSEALGQLQTARPHLIISDLNMPQMDGLTFVRSLKELPAFRFTPVIMLSTEGQDAKKQEGKAAGARAWITKPFQPPVLLDAVSRLL
jgi:two-component system, chemotaxis family, chemotaxis protein CheY